MPQVSRRHALLLAATIMMPVIEGASLQSPSDDQNDNDELPAFIKALIDVSTALQTWTSKMYVTINEQKSLIEKPKLIRAMRRIHLLLGQIREGVADIRTTLKTTPLDKEELNRDAAYMESLISTMEQESIRCSSYLVSIEPDSEELSQKLNGLILYRHELIRLVANEFGFSTINSKKVSKLLDAMDLALSTASSDVGKIIKLLKK